MSDDLTKEERYVIVRAENEGISGREAARRVGFSGGVPSPGARELWRKYQMVRDFGQGQMYRSMMERKLEEAQRKYHDIQTTLRAFDLVESTG